MKRRFAVSFVILTLLVASPCFAGQKTKKEVKRGNSLYAKGEFKEALKRYENAFLNSPDSDVVNFDLGAALYKMEDYREAISHFEKALISKDKSIEQKASYNIGNGKYKYAIGKRDENLPECIDLLKQALHHYERAIELDSQDEDAKYNYELTKRGIEQLEEKLKQKNLSSKDSKDQKQNGKQKQEEKNRQQSGKTEEIAVQKDEEERAILQQEQTGRQKEEIQHTDLHEQEQEGKKETTFEDNRKSTKETSESQKEALMLLDNYRLAEEPKGLYKEKIPLHNLPEASKDW